MIPHRNIGSVPLTIKSIIFLLSVNGIAITKNIEVSLEGVSS